MDLELVDIDSLNDQLDAADAKLLEYQGSTQLAMGMRNDARAWQKKLPTYILFIQSGIEVLDDGVLFNEIISEDGLRHEGNLVAHPEDHLELARDAVMDVVEEVDERQAALIKLIGILEQEKRCMANSVKTELKMFFESTVQEFMASTSPPSVNTLPSRISTPGASTGRKKRKNKTPASFSP